MPTPQVAAPPAAATATAAAAAPESDDVVDDGEEDDEPLDELRHSEPISLADFGALRLPLYNGIPMLQKSVWEGALELLV